MSTVAYEAQVTTGAAAAQAPKPPSPPSPPNWYIVENQTARAIRINPVDASGNRAPLILAPFGSRRIPAVQYSEFEFSRWEDPGLIVSLLEQKREDSKFVKKYLNPDQFRRYIIVAAVLIGVGLFGVIVPGILDQILAKQQDPTGIVPAMAYTFHSLLPLFLLCVIAAPLILAAFYFAQNRAQFNQGGQAVALVLVAVSVIAVAAIGPVLIMMSFTMTAVTITGRMLQMIFVVIAALLPALLYFLYDRQKVSIVTKTFYREIVLLDPAIQTSADAQEKYGHLINEVYGDKSAGYYLANVGLPISLSSVLIALGWLLILLPIIPEKPLGPADFFNLVAPQPSALSFGFLGAYFFALNMVFKRYVRSDLTPKAYSHITVRLLVTTILVWAVSVLPAVQSTPSPALLILAFCIGVVPETGIKVIQEFMRRTVGRFSMSLDERDPLTKLEGIDLYDRARLSEEGVDNIENLAYHNLIELLVQTRIPARRLADMVDQAILYLHLHDNSTPVEPASPLADPSPEASATTGNKPVLSLDYLRRYGIRTATDLIQAWQPPKERPGPSAFERILRDQCEEFADRIEIIVQTLEQADWMPQLKYRREQVTQLHETIVTEPNDFLEVETTGADRRSNPS